MEHHVQQFVAGGQTVGVIHRQLPRFGNGFETVVEGGLAIEKVFHITAVAVGISADEGTAVGVPHRVTPDVTVGVGVFGRQRRLLEPFALQRGVTRDQIHHDLQPALVRFLGQTDKIVVGAVARRDGVEIRHVVAGITERTDENGVEPHDGVAHIGDVIELGDDAVQIADAVAVGITKGLGIDVV